MKLRQVPKLFLILGIMLFSLTTHSQNQRLSQVTRQVSEPQEICTLTPTTEGDNLRILRSEFIKSKMERNTPCSTFDIDYDSAFNLNQEAKDAFDFAANIWANLLESSVPIKIDANLVSLSNPNTIGSASNGGFFEVAGQPANTAYHSALAEKLLGQEITNSSGNSIDITINMNQNFNFYYGIDPNGIAADETDFITIVLHEICHGLGMSGQARANNTIGALRFSNDLFTAYDSFLAEDSGSSFFPPTLLLQEPTTPGGTDGFEDPSEALRDAFTSNAILTTSQRAIDANNGDEPKIYSPINFAGGSSISHLDEATFNFTDDALMTPFASANEIVRAPGEIVLGIFQDMGWTLCTTGLSTEDFALEGIKLSPNPFTDSITLELNPLLSSDKFKISIVDINGRVILNAEESVNNGKIKITNLSNLKKALYFLTIESTSLDLSITRKIIKK